MEGSLSIVKTRFVLSRISGINFMLTEDIARSTCEFHFNGPVEEPPSLIQATDHDSERGMVYKKTFTRCDCEGTDRVNVTASNV
jgi:hypothetical protein